jgi:tryptophan-rich sensory protein
VWTTLYLLMAIAAWLVWRQGGWRQQRRPLTWFGLQLALNVVWSGLFFTLQNPGLGFGEIILLWLTIVATAAHFWQCSRTAALLLMPYLVWVTFAAFLNFQIWRLNL